jgi:hypothetical protein
LDSRGFSFEQNRKSVDLRVFFVDLRRFLFFNDLLGAPFLGVSLTPSRRGVL